MHPPEPLVIRCASHLSRPLLVTDQVFGLERPSTHIIC